MYKKKQFLAMCLAGLCSTTTVANVYSVTAMAATAASQTTETSTAASDAQSVGQTNPGGNPPSDASGKPGDGNGPQGNPPSGENGKPGDGQGPQGNPPDGKGQPGGENGQPGTPPDGQGGPNTQSYDYTGTLSGKLTADGEEVSSDNETISTSTADENAALVENGGTLKITNGKLQKSGDDTNGDNCNFYGINSILLAVGEKSKAYISNSALASDSEGSNAIFATDGATIYSEKNSITTTKGNAHGLDAMDSRRGRPRPDLRRCNDL